MKKIIVFLIPIFLFMACKKEDVSISPKKESDSFKIEYINNKSDLGSFDFKYSVPKDYSHIVVKETVYQYEKETIEETIIDQNLDKNTGTFKIEQDNDIDNDNLIMFNFTIPLTSSKSIVESNKFSLNSTNLNIFGANTEIGNEPKMNLFAYKEKKSNKTEDTISLDNTFFDTSTDISKKIKSGETIVVWSYEFIKK